MIIQPKTTIGQWLDVMADGDPPAGVSDRAMSEPYRLELLRRTHGLQVALDVIAHAQNIPLRLMRRHRLVTLDQTFTGMVRDLKGDIKRILTEHGAEESRKVAQRDGIDELLDGKKVGALRNWVLSLASKNPQTSLPVGITDTYVAWFLDLLPHLERQVWLTDMSNTHPAHGIARMLEHWSLFVLMWAWDMVLQADGSPKNFPHNRTSRIPKALGMNRLEIHVQHAFDREAPDHAKPEEREIWLLGGPYELEDSDPGASKSIEPSTHWFYKAFRRYCDNARRAMPGLWQDVPDKAPNSNELFDAFATRPPFDTYGASRRVEDSCKMLRRLRATRLDDSVFRRTDGSEGRPLSRANWETMAALVAWVSRWEARLQREEIDGIVRVSLPGHRLSLLTEWKLLPNTPADSRKTELLSCTLVDPQRHKAPAPPGWLDMRALLDAWNDDHGDQRIESPAAFFSRARERQHALWTSQINAISNLLSRHHRRDRPVGEDDLTDDSGTDPHCDEADHLLRGYAGKVCMHLLQMTRAEAAFVTWLDYSVEPPQLRHVGGAERLIAYRAHRESRFKQFTSWANSLNGGKAKPPCQQGASSESLLYRAVASAVVVPTPEERRQPKDHARPPVVAHFDHYPEPKPWDAIAVPLLVHGRVIGALTVNGISSASQFDIRLYSPLRLVAQLLAQAMAMQSQAWHMRRLNWLASARPLEEWRVSRSDNQYNPLKPVARLFSNIFLCPVVLIWLREEANPNRFKLHGYTRGDLLRKADSTALPHAPQLDLRDGLDAKQQPTPARHFAAFALDLWLKADQPQQLKPGSFVQATYKPTRKSDNSSLAVSTSVSDYSLENAKRGDMVLGHDFVENADAPDYRQTMFSDSAMQQVMAFALISKRGGAETPVGIVGLYSPAASGATPGDPPWATDWRPLVAQMQNYLPYVLQQTETLANPLNQLRRYLLHEGRNELMQVVLRSSTLRKSLAGLLDIDEPSGKLRPTLRKLLPRLRELTQGAPSAIELRHALDDVAAELAQIEKLAETSAQSSTRLLSVEFVEALALMARLIGHQRDLEHLGAPNSDPEFDHQVEWFSPRAELQKQFDAYRATWKALTVEPDLSALPGELEILGNKQFWNLMTQDLVRNMAKYALPHEPIRVGWSWVWNYGDIESRKSRATLWLRNFASFDPERDKPELLGQYGYRGSAARSAARNVPTQRPRTVPDGEGMGLWGAKQLGRMLSMPLEIEIAPRQGRLSSQARYDFNIGFALDLVRAPRL